MSAKQFRQMVVRALILQEDHLLVSRWENSYCFPIGGRLEHGETLEDGLLREIREEIEVAAEILKLVYFHENFFQIEDHDYHELGWFFWVRTQEVVVRPGQRLANPDSDGLWTELLPLAELATAEIFPRFLSLQLASDLETGFASNPRHIVSYEEARQPKSYRESEIKY